MSQQPPLPPCEASIRLIPPTENSKVTGGTGHFAGIASVQIAFAAETETMNIDSSGVFDCRPILCVENVARSIEYYVRCLGFKLGWAWSGEKQSFLQCGDPDAPTFALVGLGPVQFMLSERSQGAPGMWLHIDIHTADQVDALHTSWSQRGARVIEPPFVRPWGMYEMRVQDLDEHVLRVSAPPRET